MLPRLLSWLHCFPSICFMLIHKECAVSKRSSHSTALQPALLLFSSSSVSWNIYLISRGCFPPRLFSDIVRCLQLSVSQPWKLRSYLLWFGLTDKPGLAFAKLMLFDLSFIFLWASSWPLFLLYSFEILFNFFYLEKDGVCLPLIW